MNRIWKAEEEVPRRTWPLQGQHITSTGQLAPHATIAVPLSKGGGQLNLGHGGPGSQQTGPSRLSHTR